IDAAAPPLSRRSGLICTWPLSSAAWTFHARCKRAETLQLSSRLTILHIPSRIARDRASAPKGEQTRLPACPLLLTPGERPRHGRTADRSYQFSPSESDWHCPSRARGSERNDTTP